MPENEDDQSEPIDSAAVLEAIRRDFGEEAIERLRAPANLEVSLAAIEAFVIAAEHMSLSEAAATCGLEESRFRKRLDALEAWANVSLLQRRPHLVLTPDGDNFLPFAKLACAAIRSYQDLPSAERVRNALLGKVRKSPSGSLGIINKPSGRYINVD